MGRSESAKGNLSCGYGARDGWAPWTGKGMFLAGKCDRCRCDLPYHPFRQAVAGFAAMILAETEARLGMWREAVESAAGGMGGVLTEILPELEKVMGEQPPVPLLGPGETRNRFNYVFTNLLTTVCGKSLPVVLALDDLQWADSASLELLETIVRSPDTRRLMLVGTCRADRVTETFPLTSAGEGAESVALETLALKNLSASDVNALVSDALPHAPDTLPLSRIVLEKTHGNPFFISRFLTSIHERKLVRFDPEKERWDLDLPAIGKLEMTDNLVELMTEGFRKLPGSTREILKLGACLGDVFELESLSRVSGKSPGSVGSLLQPAHVNSTDVPAAPTPWQLMWFRSRRRFTIGPSYGQSRGDIAGTFGLQGRHGACGGAGAVHGQRPVPEKRTAACRIRPVLNKQGNGNRQWLKRRKESSLWMMNGST